jgi:ribosome maturation factor RimP
MREALLPSFYTKMNFNQQVAQLLETGLESKPSLFLIDLSISEANKIMVTLDGDNGVTLQDCIDISRAIEHNLDREVVDFSLEVCSAGVSSPLKTTRQYKKNIGRTLKVKTVNNTIIEAELLEANEETITLFWKTREPKQIGKGKETIEHREKIPYSNIKEAIVTITFN